MPITLPPWLYDAIQGPYDARKAAGQVKTPGPVDWGGLRDWFEAPHDARIAREQQATPGNAGPVTRNGIGPNIQTIQPKAPGRPDPSASSFMPNGTLSPMVAQGGMRDYAPPVWSTTNSLLSINNKDQSRFLPVSPYPIAPGPQTAVAAIEAAVPGTPPMPRRRPPSSDALALMDGRGPSFGAVDPSIRPPTPAWSPDMFSRGNARPQIQSLEDQVAAGLAETSPAEEMWKKTQFGGGSNIYPPQNNPAVPGGPSPYALDPTGSGRRQADAGLGQIGDLYRNPLAGLLASLANMGGSTPAQTWDPMAGGWRNARATDPLPKGRQQFHGQTVGGNGVQNYGAMRGGNSAPVPLNRAPIYLSSFSGNGGGGGPSQNTVSTVRGENRYDPDLGWVRK